MNIKPLLDALELQELSARALTDDLRTQIDSVQNRLREAETHTIARKDVKARCFDQVTVLGCFEGP
ncbi:hypothetical protein ACFW5I_32665 [Streptomyces sp. NPDC058818]|uniref:hypothetical protein n=1 Tax=Streptomyces sp. NPDC058818 TaxID=3346640 RepID=UPI0036C5DC37